MSANAWVFKQLGRVSVLKLVYGSKNPPFGVIDAYVVLSTFLALGVANLAATGNHLLLVVALLYYGAFRLVDIVVYQTNVLLFDPWRAGKDYAIRARPRSVILFLHNYAEVVFWFVAALILLHHCKLLRLEETSFTSVSLHTFRAMVSFSDVKGVHPMIPHQGILVAFQFVVTLVGAFLTLLTLGYFLSMLPQPKTLESKPPQAGSN